jgi:hypothetical protein
MNAIWNRILAAIDFVESLVLTRHFYKPPWEN